MGLEVLRVVVLVARVADIAETRKKPEADALQHDTVGTADKVASVACIRMVGGEDVDAGTDHVEEAEAYLDNHNAVLVAVFLIQV